MSTPLYERLLKYIDEQPPVDAHRWQITKDVWKHTPFMVNCRTGSPDQPLWREMMEWCREQFGPECWPIHGRPGGWQSGSATVHGWTWMGFKTLEQLEAFEARWECTRDEV